MKGSPKCPRKPYYGVCCGETCESFGVYVGVGVVGACLVSKERGEGGGFKYMVGFGVGWVLREMWCFWFIFG